MGLDVVIYLSLYVLYVHPHAHKRRCGTGRGQGALHPRVLWLVHLLSRTLLDQRGGGYGFQAINHRLDPEASGRRERADPLLLSPQTVIHRPKQISAT